MSVETPVYESDSEVLCPKCKTAKIVDACTLFYWNQNRVVLQCRNCNHFWSFTGCIGLNGKEIVIWHPDPPEPV